MNMKVIFAVKIRLEKNLNVFKAVKIEVNVSNI